MDNSEKNRKLTDAEEKRKLEFLKLKECLQRQGYAVKDLTIGMLYANVMALVLAIPIIIAFAAGFFLLNIDGFSPRGMAMSFSDNLLVNLCVFLAVIFMLIAAHELIHGISWAVFTEKHWKAISFGFILNSFTPYCTCSEAMKKSQYIFGALMPTIVLGIAPMTIAAATGSVFLLSLGAIMTIAGGGDLTIILKLLLFKTERKEALYVDHPYQAGLVVFMR